MRLQHIIVLNPALLNCVLCESAHSVVVWTALSVVVWTAHNVNYTQYSSVNSKTVCTNTQSSSLRGKPCAQQWHHMSYTPCSRRNCHTGRNMKYHTQCSRVNYDTRSYCAGHMIFETLINLKLFQNKSLCSGKLSRSSTVFKPPPIPAACYKNTYNLILQDNDCNLTWNLILSFLIEKCETSNYRILGIRKKETY